MSRQQTTHKIRTSNRPQDDQVNRRTICDIGKSVNLETLVVKNAMPERKMTMNDYKKMSSEQIELMGRIMEMSTEEPTVDFLNPVLNPFNSIKVSHIFTTGRLLKVKSEKVECEYCDAILTQKVMYFVSFGEMPKVLCRQDIQANDAEQSVMVAHIHKEHPDVLAQVIDQK